MEARTALQHNRRFWNLAGSPPWPQMHQRTKITVKFRESKKNSRVASKKNSRVARYSSVSEALFFSAFDFLYPPLERITSWTVMAANLFALNLACSPCSSFSRAIFWRFW